MNYVAQIVSAFRGVRSLATALGRPVSTVQSWKVRGSIPDEHKPAVLSIAEANGLGLTKADFFPMIEMTEMNVGNHSDAMNLPQPGRPVTQTGFAHG